MPDRPSKQQIRDSLTAEILADLEQEINDEFAWAPENLTDDDRKAIRDEILAHTRTVIDALTIAELRNDGARRAYTCTALANVQRAINWRLAQRKR